MKNKFTDFLNKKWKNIFEIIYFFIAFLFFLVLSVEISKNISLIQIFIIFVIFSIFYFIINIKSSKDKSKINKQFIKEYSSTIFYSSFLIVTIVFLLGLFYPNLENIFKYFFYLFLWIYIFLKFFGFEINFKLWNINFLTTNFLKISVILLSIISIIIYKNIHFEPIKETKRITNNKEKEQEKKASENKKTIQNKQKEIEKIYENNPEFETFEEKLKRLKKEKNKLLLKDEFDINKLENSENIIVETFEKNLYPRTKWQKKEIKKLQTTLKKLWFFSWNVNGFFDEKTLQAVKKILIKKCNWPETTKGYFWPQARECLNNL